MEESKKYKIDLSATSEFILSEVIGTIHKITLNRPLKLNAMDMYTCFGKVLDDAANNNTTIAVVTGTGKYFSSGNDLSSFILVEPSEIPDLANQGRLVLEKFVQSIINFPKPLIAMVNGHVMGIWVTVMALFDAVYCSDAATFHCPFSLLGQPPEGCSSYTFPLLMGAAKANEILMFNKKLNANEAKNLGLISEVYPSASFEVDAWRRIEEISKLNPQILRISKSLIRGHTKDKLLAVNHLESRISAERWKSADYLTSAMNFLMRKSKL